MCFIWDSFRDFWILKHTHTNDSWFLLIFWKQCGRFTSTSSNLSRSVNSWPRRAAIAIIAHDAKKQKQGDILSFSSRMCGNNHMYISRSFCNVYKNKITSSPDGPYLLLSSRLSVERRPASGKLGMESVRWSACVAMIGSGGSDHGRSWCSLWLRTFVGSEWLSSNDSRAFHEFQGDNYH